MGEEDGSVAVGDGERARGRGLEVEERERGGVGREERDGVAGEAEDEVGGAVLVALDLVGEVQLARRAHGWRARGDDCGGGSRLRVLGGKREGNAKDVVAGWLVALAWFVSRVTAAAGRGRRRRRKDPGGDGPDGVVG